jgi:hypothetical protein
MVQSENVEMVTESANSGKRTIFFHVLKTGGTTFRGILTSIYGDSFQFCEDTSLEAIQASLAKFDALEFHILPYRGNLV